jgi:hypothetical protein
LGQEEAVWLTAASTSDPPYLTGLYQLGAVGVILSIFLWFAWQVYKRERERADASAAEVTRLNQLIQDRYVPSLEESSHALRDSAALLAVLRDQRRRS